MTSKKLAVAVAVALAAPMSLGVSYAQEGASESQGVEQASDFALEVIVVTARKREEKLQEVASSVSALGAAELARRPDVDLSSFANASPNVMIDDMQEGPGSPAAISIRGIGTNDHERSIDPTVGVTVDGVFIGAVGGAMVKALDLESLEILRGPQGTLFGRNSIGGVVNIKRRKPEAEFGGEVRASYAKYDDWSVDGYVNIPVNDQLAFKLAGAKNERDGFVYNRTLGRDVGAMDYRMISPSVVWRPTANLEFYYRFDKSWTDQEAAAMLNVAQPDQAWCFFYNQCAPSLTLPQSGDRYVTLQNILGSDSYFDSDMHVFNVRWDFAEDYEVEYVFGYFESDENSTWDYDGTPLTLYHDNPRPQVYDQRSHEIRLAHVGDGALSYTVGGYVWNSGYRLDLTSDIGFGDLLFGLPAGAVLPVQQSIQQKTDSYAAFFEGDLRLGDDWTLTIGGRYTRDEKTNGVIDPNLPELAVKGGIGNPVKKSWSEFTPKLSLRYRISPDLMAYGLYSRGFRAGGFSGRPGTYEAVVTPYDPELVDNFELGVKTEWFDRRLRVNGSVFFMKYDDKQEELNVPVAIEGGTGQQQLFINAASAELKGVEIDFMVAPFLGFTLTGSLGLLDAEYKEFVDPLTGGSLTHLKLRRAPEVTATLSPAYEWPALAGLFSARADWHYIAEHENTFLNSPQTRNSSQNVVDATVNYEYNNTTVSVFGRNLTEEDGYTIGLDVGRTVDSPGLWSFTGVRAPRTFGIRITQRF